MFAGDRSDEREIPHYPGNFLAFTTLSGPQLDEADLEGSRRAAEQMKAMPESILNQAMSRENEPRKNDPDVAFRGYDNAVLVKYGVKSWRGPMFAQRDCTPENRVALEVGVLEWAARQVFEINVRPEGEGEDSASKSSTARKEPSLQS